MLYIILYIIILNLYLYAYVPQSLQVNDLSLHETRSITSQHRLPAIN